MNPLCKLGWHQWRVSRTESIRYGIIVTYRCSRCPAQRTESKI